MWTEDYNETLYRCIIIKTTLYGSLACDQLYIWSNKTKPEQIHLYSEKTNTHRNDWQHRHGQYNTRVSECVLCPSSTYGFWLQLWYLSKLPSDKQVSTRCAHGIPVYQLNADKLPIAEEMHDTIMSEYGTIQYFVANTS